MNRLKQKNLISSDGDRNSSSTGKVSDKSGKGTEEDKSTGEISFYAQKISSIVGKDVKGKGGGKHALKRTHTTGSTKFPKRYRMITASLSITIILAVVLFFIERNTSIVDMIKISVGIGVLATMILPWVLRFELSFRDLFRIGFLPFVFVSLFSFSVIQIYYTQFSRFLDMLTFFLINAGFGISIYILYLTQNILNIARVKSIPLLPVAQTVSYFYTIITVFLMIHWGWSAHLPIFITSTVVSLISLILFYIHLSHLKPKKKDNLLEALALGYVLLSLLVAVSFWPNGSLSKAAIGAGVVYVGLGLIMHKSKNILSIQVIFEYLMVAFVLVGVLVLSSEWGIYDGIVDFVIPIRRFLGIG